MTNASPVVGSGSIHLKCEVAAAGALAKCLVKEFGS